MTVDASTDVPDVLAWIDAFDSSTLPADIGAAFDIAKVHPSPVRRFVVIAEIIWANSAAVDDDAKALGVQCATICQNYGLSKMEYPRGNLVQLALRRDLGEDPPGAPDPGDDPPIQPAYVIT